MRKGYIYKIHYYFTMEHTTYHKVFNAGLCNNQKQALSFFNYCIPLKNINGQIDYIERI